VEIMPYDAKKELKRVTDYYNNDSLQKRFSAIISGESGAGKSYLLRSCRFPIHIDSFDPGGTKCLSDLIRCAENPRGQIIADTSYENEDPYDPTVYSAWEKDIEVRLQTDYFDMFGTYALDSLSTFGDAVMNYILKKANRAGEVPMHRRDYNPQKTVIVNKIKKLMSLSCDFILMAHLRESEDTIGMSKDGVPIKTEKYRLQITGNAIVTIPLQFDELYVLFGKGSPVKRKLILDSQGKYVARSRLKAKGLLSHEEEPDIKGILKKIGKKWEDLPKLED
jgi:hypothetical protein